MQHGRLRAIFIVLLLFSGIAGAALLVVFRPEPPQKDVVQTAPLVEVLPVESRPVTFTVSSQGSVLPRTETVLSAEVAGSIVSISPKFVAGGFFDAGEELMRIDPTNYEVAVEQAEALVRQRQIEYDGASKLRESGYRAEAELASAAAALASARAERVRAQRNLERTRIVLPYAGMVRAKEADLGQYVNVGSRLGVTFATDAAEVRLPLTDGDLGFLSMPTGRDLAATGDVDGPAVELRARLRGVATSWPAKIVRTEGVVDELTRVTFAIAAVEDPYALESLDPDQKALQVGTFVAAEIEGITIDDVVVIPRTAVRGNGQVVVITDEDRIEMRSVDILRADADVVYVRAGLSPGERISLTVIENPINGLPVRSEVVMRDEDTMSGINAPGSQP